MDIAEIIKNRQGYQVPSIDVTIESYLKTRIFNKKEFKSYIVSDKSGQIRLETEQNLFISQRYKAKAEIAQKGMNGIEYTPFRNMQKLTITTKMNQAPNHTPPYTKDQIENYCLSLYFSTKAKALTKEEITKEQAHEIGLKIMDLVPKYFFGEKQLP